MQVVYLETEVREQGKEKDTLPGQCCYSGSPVVLGHLRSVQNPPQLILWKKVARTLIHSPQLCLMESCLEWGPGTRGYLPCPSEDWAGFCSFSESVSSRGKLWAHAWGLHPRRKLPIAAILKSRVRWKAMMWDPKHKLCFPMKLLWLS